VASVVVSFDEISAWTKAKTPFRNALLPKIDQARAEEPTTTPRLSFNGGGTVTADLLMIVCSAFDKALLE
jgi:hypothetical protein